MSSRRRAVLEIGAVFLSGLAFLFLDDFVSISRFAVITGICVVWVSYLLWRLVTEKASIAEWGIRTDNLVIAAVPCLAFVLVAATAMLLYRMRDGGPTLPTHAVAVFGLYTLWGAVQQLLLQAFVAENFRRLHLPRGILIPVVSVLFGLVHAPAWKVVALTIPAAAVWTFLYLRRPNILVLGMSHAALGTLAYYWVFQRDPWVEIFGG